jgi:1-deoxy-D-xylulose-5-phosphate reductoisomerase
VLNGADESAVAAFLDGRLPFDRIVTVVGRVLDEHLTGTEAEVRWVEGNNAGLPDVLGADRWARSRADLLIREGI